MTKQNTDDIIKTVKERKQNKKRGRITVMKLYEINEGFEGTQEGAIVVKRLREGKAKDVIEFLKMLENI